MRAQLSANTLYTKKFSCILNILTNMFKLPVAGIENKNSIHFTYLMNSLNKFVPATVWFVIKLIVNIYISINSSRKGTLVSNSIKERWWLKFWHMHIHPHTYIHTNVYIFVHHIMQLKINSTDFPCFSFHILRQTNFSTDLFSALLFL